jgi:hypothetical protein
MKRQDSSNSEFQFQDSNSRLPRSLRAFLCHSSGDRLRVRNLYKRLSVGGVDPWLDKENLLPGQNWQQEIRNTMRIMDVVIVCISQNSVNKVGFVQKEILFALDVADEHPTGTIFVIPVKLEKCELPERLSHLHTVNLYEKRGFELLMRALKSRADELGVALKPEVSPQVVTPQSIDLTFISFRDSSELVADVMNSLTVEQVTEALIDTGFIPPLNDPSRSYLLTIKGRNIIAEGQTLYEAGVRSKDLILVNIIQRGG